MKQIRTNYRAAESSRLEGGDGTRNGDKGRRSANLDGGVGDIY